MTVLLTAVLLLVRRRLPVTHSSTPFWIRTLLVLEPAVEFPLILAFHPTTLASRVSMTNRLPGVDGLALQVLIFFAVELAFHKCVLRFITITPKHSLDKATFRSFVEKYPSYASHDEDAERLVFDFARPRGALLLAIGLLGRQTGLTRFTGQLHPMAMVLWIALEQLVNCDAPKLR